MPYHNRLRAEEHDQPIQQQRHRNLALDEPIHATDRISAAGQNPSVSSSVRVLGRAVFTSLSDAMDQSGSTTPLKSSAGKLIARGPVVRDRQFPSSPEIIGQPKRISSQETKKRTRDGANAIDKAEFPKALGIRMMRKAQAGRIVRLIAPSPIWTPKKSLDRRRKLQHMRKEKQQVRRLQYSVHQHRPRNLGISSYDCRRLAALGTQLPVVPTFCRPPCQVISNPGLVQQLNTRFNNAPSESATINFGPWLALPNLAVPATRNNGTGV